MAELNSNELSLIEYMQKSDEHLRKGVSLINDRGNPGRYFEAIQAAGLLAPGNNPAPVQTKDGEYYQIPFWPILDYLAACAKQANDQTDGELANWVMQLVRDVSQSVASNDGEPDNYHTFRVFADILGLIPKSAVVTEDLDLIPIWIAGRFDRGGVCHALDKGAMSRFLESDNAEDWQKALRIMEHCTRTRWVDKEGFSGGTHREPESVVDDYWLKEMVKHHAASLGQKLGQATAEMFLNWASEVYRSDERQLPSYMFRPAIEEHEQNYDWKSVDNRCVEALRDALNAWVETGSSDARAFIRDLLQHDLDIIRRIAIFAANAHWEELGALLPEFMDSDLFSQDIHHELYGLLDARFASFPNSLKEATVDTIEAIPQPTTDDNPELLLAHIQRRWLSAIAGKGSNRADQLHAALLVNESLGRPLKHPDFLAYSERRVGPGPSPYTPQELTELNRKGALLSTLIEFKPDGSWEGPTTRALVDSLEAAVSLDPSSFLAVLPDFLAAQRCYQYGVINGFKELWDRTDKDAISTGFDWGHAWPALFAFFSQLLADEAFWNEDTVEDQDMTPTRDWIPGLIADFVRAGSRNDEKAYSPDLLPTGLEIIDRLLIKGQAVNAPDDDAMHQAINSQKGRAIEALHGHALRSARVADKVTSNHDAAWVSVEPIFNRELGYCKGANFEFSTLLGTYFANLEYLNTAWVENRIQDIFPDEHPQNFVCALGGLAYGQATRRSFSLMRDNNVFDVALAMDLPGDHTREKLVERIALAYLWGDEPLDSTRFAQIFDNRLDQDLETIATLFWSVSNQDIADDQVERIMAFWRRCVEWAEGLVPVPEALLAKLSLLSCYLDEISDNDLPLMLAGVPYVNESNYSWEFAKALEHLASESPQNVVQVLDKYLEDYQPSYDYGDRLRNLVSTLAQEDQKAAALRFAEKMRHLSGMGELYQELMANDG